MSERFLEKWIIKTDEDLYFDELADYIEIPNYVNSGRIRSVEAQYDNLYSKEGKKYKVCLVKKYVPGKDFTPSKPYMLLLSSFEKNQQFIYVAESDTRCFLDMEELLYQVDRFEHKLSKPRVFGEYGHIEQEKAVRIYNRYVYYQYQEGIEAIDRFYTDADLNLKDYFEERMTSYELVAEAKIGLTKLSTVFKVHSKEHDKDFLVAVESFSDLVEMQAVFLSFFAGDLDPELVAFKAADYEEDMV